MRSRKSRFSFTLIELLLIVGIIAILAAILLPALSRAKDVAKEIQCVNLQKHISVAFMMYTSDNNGYFPPVCDATWYGGSLSKNPEWYFGVGQYLGYKNWQLGGTTSCISSGDKRNDVLWCPSFSLSTPGVYAMYYDTIGGYGMNRFLPPADQFSDWKEQFRTYGSSKLLKDPSSKILTSDTRQGMSLGGYWEFTQSDPKYFFDFDRVRHRNGANVSYCDGHIKWRSCSFIMSKVPDQSLF